MFERTITSETTLVIRHIPESNPATFQVMRLGDGKTTEPVSPPSPHGFPVEGRPNSDLLRELQWYLETVLDYPFPPEIDHADRVLKALKDWGEQTFGALFDNRSAGRMFEAATSGDYSGLNLQISSDDATARRILNVIARSRMSMGSEKVDWTPDLRQALASEFDAKPASPVSEGELARQALLVLAEDPDTRDAIETLAAQPQSLQKFDFGAGIAITAAVLIVLQTHIRFKRGTDGKYSLLVEKKPTSDALLKGLVQKSVSYIK
jgi:hypothetical protein